MGDIQSRFEPSVNVKALVKAVMNNNQTITPLNYDAGSGQYMMRVPMTEFYNDMLMLQMVFKNDDSFTGNQVKTISFAWPFSNSQYIWMPASENPSGSPSHDNVMKIDNISATSFRMTNMYSGNASPIRWLACGLYDGGAL